MTSELVYSRIASKELKNASSQMRAEIRSDSTPVPMFGNYRDATIATIGVNPSSKEFPLEKKERRLIHLSDIRLPPDFYQRGGGEMSFDQVSLIEKGIVNYFHTENTYWKWFGYAEDSLNVGFEASYTSSNVSKLACHVDVFPWATKKVSSLNSELRREFMQENAFFVESYLKQSSIKNVIFLGSDSLHGLRRQLNLKFKMSQSEMGPIGSTFEFGTVQIGSISMRYFYTSKGPSVQFLQNSEKKEIHKAFGDFIKEQLLYELE